MIYLLNDVGHQAEISLDEDIPGLLVALGVVLKVLPLLGGGERLWKGTASGEAQGKQQGIGEQQQRGRQHEHPSRSFYAGRGSPHAEKAYPLWSSSQRRAV